MEQQQHPTTITCPQCQTSIRRAGFTHSCVVYGCFCGATVREMPKTYISKKGGAIRNSVFRPMEQQRG
jgi:hypothetical protein